MSSWAVVAIIAIIVWGIVQVRRDRAEHGVVDRDDRALEEENVAARKEIAALQERIKVLERIATDNNSLDARERARIAEEIEALREPRD